MNFPKHFAKTLAVTALAALTLAGCAGGTAAEPQSTPPAAQTTDQADALDSALTGEITVLAAASLTGSFTQLAEEFMAEPEGVTINLSFGSSSALDLTVSEGSPADILATADEKSMGVALAGNDTATSKIFAGNDLVIAVAKDNPEGITGLEQLSGSDLRIARCAAEVPCGRLADSALTAGNLTIKAVTEGADVKATLTPLITGEVDAALVYRTDVIASQDVSLVELEPLVAQQTVYPMVVLTDSEVAAAFYDAVVSEHGMATLASFGFTAN